MDATHEEWRPVVGWEGYYEVSNWGRIRSVDRRVARKGQPPAAIKGQLLHPSPVKDKGYLTIKLSREGKAKTVTVHVLVLKAFVGPRPSPEIDCCHNDGDPANNRLSNLRWDTRASNAQDIIKHGRNWAVNKTHCAPAGHEYTSENTYITPWGTRQCRACRNEKSRASHQKRRAAQEPQVRVPKTHCRNRHEFTPANTYINTVNGSRQCRICLAEASRRFQRKKRLARQSNQIDLA